MCFCFFTVHLIHCILKMVLRGKLYVLATIFLLSHVQTTAARELFRKDGSEHAVKTIQTENGDMYDCVDFYKQPAFNHPLLKNHDFHPEMRPTSRPQRINRGNSSMIIEIPLDMIMLKDGGCPQGTVPIRRILDKDDLLQSEVLPHHSAEETNPIISEAVSGAVFSIGQTKSNPLKKYYGVAGTLSVYNPQQVVPNQYSSAEIIIKGGVSDLIIAGWTVNPNKYPDNKTRFFVYAVAGDMRCFNNACGFISVRSDIPLDMILSPVSQVGGKIYVFHVFVYQDVKNGNWWLAIGPGWTVVGFWPREFFKGMQSPATYAACGGEIHTPETLPPPDMGARNCPRKKDRDKHKKVAFCTDMFVLDESQSTVEPESEGFVSNSEYGGEDTHDPMHMIYFGGPACSDAPIDDIHVPAI